MKKPDDLKQIKELLEIVKHKVDTMEVSRTGQFASLHLMKDQQSVINAKLDAISKDLNNPKTGLKRINERMEVLWDQVVEVTADLEGVGEIMDSHTAYLKRIETKIDKDSEDIEKLDKRLSDVEDNAGIIPRPELTLVR